MEEAKKTLLNFFEEMNVWNDETYKKIHGKEEINLEIRRVQKTKLIEILSKYCTLPNLNDVTLTYSESPEYSVESQLITNSEVLTRNKVFVYTSEIDEYGFEYRYTLVRKNEQWLIDKKHWFSKSKEKWIKDLL